MKENSMDKTNNGGKPQAETILDESTINLVDGDDVWKFIGRFGRYQKWQTLLIFLVSTTLSFPILSGLFVGKDVDFKCSGEVLDVQVPPNANLELSSCSQRVVESNTSRLLSESKCMDYQFEGNGTALTYLAEWNLVCGHETLGNLPQTLTMVGMAIGASTLPQFGDRFGRKKLIVGSLVGVSAVSLALAFIQQFEVFVVFKFLSGVLNQGFMVPINVVMVELLPTEMRSVACLLSTTFWVMSSLLTGVIGYTMREYDWRTMQIAYGSVAAAVVIFLCFMDESLRWVLRNTKIPEAEAQLKKACRMNNKDYQELLKHAVRSKEENGIGEPGSDHSLLSPLDAPEQITPEHKEGSSSNLMILLKNKNMRRITLVMCYTWMISSLTYYGLILLSTSLAGDPYVNYFVGAAAEWPCGLLMVFCIQKFGRKRTILSFQLISGVSLVCAVVIANVAPSDNTTYSTLQTCFTVMGKFFVSGSFNGIWIYTPELYPTNFRNMGIGLASASARIGATFSPFFKILARKALWAPGALFAAGCFLNVFLLTLVPETRWRELPRDVSDIDMWIESDKKNKRNKNITVGDSDKNGGV